jgi:hypothetical protein
VIGYIAEIGRHPEIIESAVRTSKKEKLKAIRPLKSKLAELDSRYRTLSREVKSCVEAAKKSRLSTSLTNSSRKRSVCRGKA